MKRIPLAILSVVLVSLVAVAGVYAQTGESTALDEDGASLSIVETVPVTASVDVNINGQIYKLAIPVTVNIDAQQDLSDALLSAQAVDRVGIVLWKITAITEHDDKFDLSAFQEIEPSSPDNKLVVVESDVTNMDTEPYSYYASGGERLAYDEAGNLYDATDQSCDDINPGSKQSCIFVFDVPKTANILGLDLKVIDHKRIPFTAQE